MKIKKRNLELVPFDKERIIIAIEKAMTSPSGFYVAGQAEEIAQAIEDQVAQGDKVWSVFDIEKEVYLLLSQAGNHETARAYEAYRAIHQYKREENTTDESVLSLIERTNKDLMSENSNKNALIASTQRDLIAGEVSKDIARRKLLPSHLVEAHDSGAIHIHDMDYFIQEIFNCCLVNMKDMLDKGTVVNSKMIESPKSFQVACNVMTQIIAQIASNQYGGQSIDISCLSKYLRRSYEKNLATAMDATGDLELAEKLAQEFTQKDLESGVQTIQYQINTLMTSNGQAPFVTLFMHVKDEDPYKEETARIVEEILKQRIKGIKNEVGVYITPAFPKLVYVLDENNIEAGRDFYYLTALAVRCTAKRLYPDYISAKVMKEQYEGNVFAPMGCRAFLPPWKDEAGNYQFDGRFNIGVCSVNIPQAAILANGSKEAFYHILEERMELAREVGLLRAELLSETTSDISPIHWQHGAIARLEPGEKIAPLLKGGYATVTLGYIGIYEATKLLLGVSHTDPKGEAFAHELMDFMNQKVDEWTQQGDYRFALYGTPAESLTHRFASLDRERFGLIKDITDKGYYTNSFHVDVREPISVFEKFRFEGAFQRQSKGGCISYAEIPNMGHNLEALEAMIRYIYDNIQYAEFNTKSDYCHVCGYDGEMTIGDDLVWTCPQCGNQDKNKMNVVRRTCGYLGENFWNEGRTKEIKDRVLHV